MYNVQYILFVCINNNNNNIIKGINYTLFNIYYWANN